MSYRSFNRIIRVPDFPEMEQVLVNDFSGGYVSHIGRDIVPANASPNTIDIEVTKKNRLRRMAGVAPIEFLADEPKQTFLHANLDNRSELIFFAPPYVGVKGDGNTEWFNAELRDTIVTAANFGGTLIFSDGNRVFARQASAQVIDQLTGVPVANSYAAFAARLVAGGAIIDGKFEPLGVVWSAANSNYEDFVSTGAGFELLINDMTEGDRIVAMSPMGLDFMAILLRRSVWIGRRTGLITRPIDFQPRVTGTGAISWRTVKTTRFGVIFLSDSGVNLFDGNTANLISEQINGELLPLDLDQIDRYSAVYDPSDKRYYLLTPDRTWVYRIEQQRWEQSSLIAWDGAVFPEQATELTWAELSGSWEDQGILRWRDYSPEQGEELRLMFISTMNEEGVLGELSYSTNEYFGVPLTPIWESPIAYPAFRNRLITIKQANLEFAGTGSIELYVPDINGVYQPALLASVSGTDNPLVRPIYGMFSGRGYGMQIRNLSAGLEVLSVQLIGLSRGIRIESLE